MTTVADIEIELSQHHLTGPRVTEEMLNENIKGVEIVTHVSTSGHTFRWAIITTANGFPVTGDPSVCVSPENDREVVGIERATEKAKQELWKLMAYDLWRKMQEGKV